MTRAADHTLAHTSTPTARSKPAHDREQRARLASSV